MLNAVLEHMVEEAVVSIVAGEHGIVVDDAQVERALSRKAASESCTIDELLVKAQAEGVDDYRAEVRRLVLEEILIKRFSLPGIDNDPGLAESVYRDAITTEEVIEIRKIVRPFRSASEAQEWSISQRAADDARKGVDFCVLVEQLSREAPRRRCGSTGVQFMADLSPTEREVAGRLPPGAISDPLRMGATFWVVQRIKPDRKPSFEEVKPAMTERVERWQARRRREAWFQQVVNGFQIIANRF